MSVSIVIPNYNGEEILKRNIGKVIQAVGEYKKGSIEIIIVDDASEDDSVKVIEALILEHKKIAIKLLKNSKNLGFSSTVNKGVKESVGDILVLFNTDVIPQPDFLHTVSGHFSDDTVFAVGFMDKSIEGEKTVLRGRGIGQWKRGLLMHAAGDVKKTDTLWASGGSSAFRSSIWKKLGGFNEFYNPFYWEDIDLSYRALKSGYTIHFDPRIVVVHEHEKGSIRTHYSPFQYKLIAHRNAILFVWLNITDASLLFSHIIWLPYHIVKTLSSDGSAFLLAFLQALVRLPRVIMERSKLTRSFTISDKRVLSQYTL